VAALCRRSVHHLGQSGRRRLLQRQPASRVAAGRCPRGSCVVNGVLSAARPPAKGSYHRCRHRLDSPPPFLGFSQGEGNAWKTNEMKRFPPLSQPFPSPDEWGPSIGTAVNTSPSQQSHARLTSGAPQSEIMSICSESVICANCKKSPLGW
jgi:hypothetical protein